MIIPLMRMHRFEWQQRWIEGKVLDVGCCDTSEWNYPIHPDSKIIIKDLVFCDLNAWKILWRPNYFIQADAHNLPFKNNSFDTICACEVLEHCENPYIVLQELKRISKYKIILTVPSEYDWKGELKKHTSFSTNPENPDGTFANFAYGDKKLTIEEKVLAQTLNLKSDSAKCIRYMPETDAKHAFHYRWFKDDSIIELIESVNMNYLIVKLDYCDLHYITYGILLWKDL